jgi:hypothetical protein
MMSNSNLAFARLDLEHAEESALRAAFPQLDGGLPADVEATTTVTARLVSAIVADSCGVGWQSAVECVRRNVAAGRDPLDGLVAAW